LEAKSKPLHDGIRIADPERMKCKVTFYFGLVGWFAATAVLASSAPRHAGDSGQVTADQQKSNKTDRSLTQQIRRAVVSDKTLSTSAHNVKIITRDGMVTLRGVVKSDDEKKAIEDKATQIAGQGKVSNELTVAANGSK
jgi:osmotically-inducible protein OsmY